MKIKFMADGGRKRDKRINFWITQIEYDDIKSRAADLDLTISEYLRMLALNADINMSLNKIKVSTSLIEAEIEGTETSEEELAQYFTEALSGSSGAEEKFKSYFNI